MSRQLKFLSLKLTHFKIIATLFAAMLGFCGFLSFRNGNYLSNLWIFDQFKPSFGVNIAYNTTETSMLGSSFTELEQNGTSAIFTADTTLVTLLHPSDFLILETDICKNVNPSLPLLLVIVHSDPTHHDFRSAVRETWGNGNVREYGLDSDIEMRIIFALGSRSTDSEMMANVRKESQISGDIIQGTFFDSYKNLTHKLIMWLKWTTFYCQNAFHILKDGQGENHYLQGLERYTFQKKYQKQMVRDCGGVDVYPDYCSGGAYMLSGDLPKKLYEASTKIRFFWIDDIYATGLLRERIGNITVIEIGSKYVVFPSDFGVFGHQHIFGVKVRNYFCVHLDAQSQPQYTWWSRLLREYGLNAPVIVK